MCWHTRSSGSAGSWRRNFDDPAGWSAAGEHPYRNCSPSQETQSPRAVNRAGAFHS